MAERSARREWISTCIAGFALLVAGVSAYFSWQAIQMKKESLAIVARPTYDCPIFPSPPRDDAPLDDITLCWLVDLSNTSEARLTILEYDFEIREVLKENVWLVDYQPLVSVDGKPPPDGPINLDSGEGKQLVVRTSTHIPLGVAKTIAQMPEYKSGSTSTLSLPVVEDFLADKGMDILGNQLPYTSAPLSKTFLLTIRTGRGITYNHPLTFFVDSGFSPEVSPSGSRN